MLTKEIYRENVLDHYKNPRNFGKLDKPSFKLGENNPVCGDEIEMYVNVNENKVSEVMFDGKGCAVSQASASMLTEYVKGKTLEEIKHMSKEDIFSLLGIKLGVVRMKCALLSLNILQKGVENYETGN